MRKRVLITGGSEGLGLCIAEAFSKCGCDLVLCARREDKLIQAADYLRKKYGTGIQIFCLDLSEEHSAAALFEAFSDVDILVNNAGAGYTGISWLSDVVQERKLYQLNMTAPALLSRLYLETMVKRGSGTIINVCSTGAFQPGPYIASYYASKSFLLNYTLALAEEAQGSGVHVCCFAPGPLKTDFYEKYGGLMPRLAMDPQRAAEILIRKYQDKQLVVTGQGALAALLIPAYLRMKAVKKIKKKQLERRSHGAI